MRACSSACMHAYAYRHSACSMIVHLGVSQAAVHRNIEKEKQRAEQAARDVKAKAKAMAVALQTIGKFIIKKKVGDGNKIFGR